MYKFRTYLILSDYENRRSHHIRNSEEEWRYDYRPDSGSHKPFGAVYAKRQPACNGQTGLRGSFTFPCNIHKRSWQNNVVDIRFILSRIHL